MWSSTVFTFYSARRWRGGAGMENSQKAPPPCGPTAAGLHGSKRFLELLKTWPSLASTHTRYVERKTRMGVSCASESLHPAIWKIRGVQSFSRGIARFPPVQYVPATQSAPSRLRPPRLPMMPVTQGPYLVVPLIATFSYGMFTPVSLGQTTVLSAAWSSPGPSSTGRNGRCALDATRSAAAQRDEVSD